MPPIIKLYEAFGCIADGRIEMMPFSAQVFSSSRAKFYTVIWDGNDHLMCNDNGSFWQGYLGYPAIAFLCLKGLLPYSEFAANALKDIAWKDINENNKNDFGKTLDEVRKIVTARGVDFSSVQADVETTYAAMRFMPFHLLGNKLKPPQGY